MTGMNSQRGLGNLQSEGMRLPSTAQRLKVRKQVTGVKYFSAIGKSGWAILISRRKKSLFYKRFLGYQFLNIPASTAGKIVSVTKYVKNTLKHCGKHLLKIRKYGIA